MAQMETTRHAGNSRGRNGRHRKPLFIDLTPMVDLAFLLITFFMLTTSMKKPNAMDLNMPADGATMDISRDRLLTVIADKNNILWYYTSDQAENMQQTNYSADGLRTLLYENIQRVNDMHRNWNGLICLIKTTDDANYQNLVDLLDEMVITKVPVYAIQPLTDAEKEILQNRN